jgi:hypothetical protein
VIAVGMLSLGACGRAKSGPHAGRSGNAGASGWSGEKSAGEGGDDGTTGGSSGSGGKSGAGAGGTTSGGAGGTTSGGVGGEMVGGSGAGAAAGASGNGGGGSAGGSSPLPNLPLPAECQALRGSATELLCDLDVECGAEAQTMRCYRATGAWQCTCAPPNSNKMYLIEGAAGLDVCAVGAGLCAGLSPDPVVDPDSCTLVRDEVGTQQEAGQGIRQTCTIELQCETPVPVDFAPEVQVTLPGVAMTHCVEAVPESTENVRLDCDTTGSYGTEGHEVVAGSLAGTCHTILEFHLSSEEAVFDGSKSCISVADGTASSDYCSLNETCFDAAPVSTGVSLVQNPAQRSTYCGFDDLGYLACGCRFESSIDGVDTFDYGLGVVARPAMCDLSDCTLEMRAEATGPGTCHAQQEPGERYEYLCSDDFSCDQPATLAGRDITIHSWVNVRCELADDGAFYCGCAAGDETATFRAGVVASSGDACAMARTECLEHLALPLGPASYGTRAPDPRPGI